MKKYGFDLSVHMTLSVKAKDIVKANEILKNIAKNKIVEKASIDNIVVTDCWEMGDEQ